MAKRKNLIGIKFGRLLVTGLDPVKHLRRYWLVRCECGTEKSVSGLALTQGGTVSCGCFARERMAEQGKKNTKHGGSLTPEYRSYTMMIFRCRDPRCKSFKDYGGRGITVCERWANSFSAFREDMGKRPDGTSLDRINNDGNYEPNNCKWSSRSEQNRNTRKTKYDTINGVTKPRREWIEASKYDRTTIYKRLKRGMTIEEALL